MVYQLTVVSDTTFTSLDIGRATIAVIVCFLVNRFSPLGELSVELMELLMNNPV